MEFVGFLRGLFSMARNDEDDVDALVLVNDLLSIVVTRVELLGPLASCVALWFSAARKFS